ncbi:hypothetical protein K8R04_00330 [Candidatus Uhrbacteria bacterium]|nr:hypothetical protein [Candidatus Uhrbacteria bacterium]
MKRAFPFLLAILVATPWPLLAQAAVSRSSYNISIVSVNAPKALTPGARGEITVEARNTGSASWTRTGTNFVSIYSYDPIKKQEVGSVFYTSGWDAPTRPARLPVEQVKPGETATFRFPIVAPSKLGSYTAEFVVVVEGLVRLSNGRFNVTVNSSNSAASVPVAAPAVSAPAPVSTLAPTGMPTGSSKYAAQYVSGVAPSWQIELDQNVIAEIAYKNTGTETWKRDEGAFVSLYAVEGGASGSKERTSSFQDQSWTGARAAKMVESEVKPGSIGHFKVELRAKTPGDYREEFLLSAENIAWMADSRIFLNIKVPTNGSYIARNIIAPSNTISATQAAINAGYSALLMLRSTQSVSTSGNGRMQLTVGFKNTGTKAWGNRSLQVRGVTAATTAIAKYASVRDDSWREGSTPVKVEGLTKPGELGLLTFTVKAPAKKGEYRASFQMYADNQPVDGGIIDIPITVTADGYIEPEPVPAKPIPTVTTPTPAPSNPTPNAIPSLNPQPLNGDVASLPNEPLMRVGIFATTDDKMTIRAKYAPLEVRNGSSVVCTLPVGQSVIVTYDRSSSIYRIAGDCPAAQSSTYYVVKAQDGLSPMEMSDFSRPVGWLPGANDNTFRAHLELRWSPTVSQAWVINELPIEWYLKGIAETSNVSPMQYQRTLLVAARTYAMYHVQRQTKHASKFFIVDATYDQVYRGYGQEARSPTIVAAVDATRGQIVTYQGKLALTPYFSRSDGRTRSWGEVWYGQSNYPWLVSVPVPDDVGKTLWGHGVGMSATGALQMDAKWGKTYDQILAHFYTGTELRRVYK